jgi:hypothetical protein
MNSATMSLSDLSGTLLAFTFTIFILSYVTGDNILFRLASHIFIGVAAGYASVVTLYNVILPQLVFPFLDGSGEEKFLAFLLLVPCILLLMKLSPRWSKLGNPAIAILVGIGAAAAVGGAILGTIFPQTVASINVFSKYNFIDGAILLVGTITTLLYFQFNRRQKTSEISPFTRVTNSVGWLGKAFIAITFGALFAGVYTATLSALIERFSFLINTIKELVIPAFY